MINVTLPRIFSAIGIFCLMWLILQFSASYINLPTFVRIKCFLKQDCTIVLNDYRPDLDWGDFCVKSYLNPRNSVPCEFCYVIELKRENKIIDTQMVDMPVYDEIIRTQFSENSNQCFDKNFNALKINKRNKFSLLRYEIEINPVANF